MLPPDRYELACRLFCRILRRLEERDRRNDHQYQTNTPTRYIDEGSGNPDVETGATNKASRADLPPRIIARAEEER